MRRHIYHIMAVNVATEDDDARHKLSGRELATLVVLLTVPKLERGIANVRGPAAGPCQQDDGAETENGSRSNILAWWSRFLRFSHVPEGLGVALSLDAWLSVNRIDQFHGHQ